MGGYEEVEGSGDLVSKSSYSSYGGGDVEGIGIHERTGRGDKISPYDMTVGTRVLPRPVNVSKAKIQRGRTCAEDSVLSTQ